MSLTGDLLTKLSEANAEITALRAENSSLSAWQCVYTDGKTGLVGDEHGNQYCAMAKENERLRAGLADPAVVHINMLAGVIAKPSLAQIIHIYGEDALRAALEGKV